MLDANLEPVFADLVTDPRFADVANELLAPRSYSDRHDTTPLLGVECTACAPFSIMFLASPENQGHLIDQDRLPREGVVTLESAQVRRARARSFGPKPTSTKSTPPRRRSS